MSFKKKMLPSVLAVIALLAGYASAYLFIPRLPAANLAYFVYSDNPGVDSTCYYFFLPAYRLHQRFNKLRNIGFTRHNWDRPAMFSE